MQGANEEPLGDALLTTDVVAALRLAATRRAGRPVGTFDLLAALVAVDSVGAWETVQLRTTFVAPDGRDGAEDDDPDETGGSWSNVPLTRGATDALAIAAEIADAYRMRPLPPGVLALGLVWRSDVGAARALLEEAEIDQAELIGLIQDELLDVRLEGLESAVVHRAGQGAAHADPPTEDDPWGPSVPPPGSREDFDGDPALSRLLDLPGTAPSLADHLVCSERGEEPRLSSEDYARAIAGVAARLQALHDRGLVHRNVRPANLVTDPQTGRLEPAGPAIAGDGPVASGAIGGRRDDRYVAPECRAGEVGPSIDQYALGAIAREVFTARGAPRLTVPVRNVLARATAANPSDRFGRVAAFGEALVASMDAEAPHGLSEWLERMPATARATFTPTAISVAIALASMVQYGRESLLGVALTFVFTALILVAATMLPWLLVWAAGGIRGWLGRPSLTFVNRPLVPFTALLVVTAYLFATDASANEGTVFQALIATYCARSLLAPPPPTAGHWLVRIARRWDRRQTLRPAARVAVSAGVPAALVAALALPAAAQIAVPAPPQLPTAPLADYPPLVAVAAFRATVGERDFDYVCAKSLTRKAAGPRDYCVALARFVAAVQDADPVAKAGPEDLFGVRGTLEGFVVQELPSPGGGRAWNFLTTPEHAVAGFMHTAGRRTDRVTVQVSRDPPVVGRAPFTSLWLYDLVQTPDRWRIAHFRACEIGGPGTGRQDGKCVVRDGLPAAQVRAIDARLRARAAR
jgi:hypothetical protein